MFSFLLEMFSLERFQGDENSKTIVFGLLISLFGLSSLLFLAGFAKKKLPTSDAVPPIEKDEPTKKKPKERKAICPFSKDSNFIVETAEHLKATPLDLFEDWVTNNATVNKPLAARWLAAGLSGQDTPGLLRAGLKRLRNSRHFLVVEPHRIRAELELKKKALDNPERHPIVFVAEPESLDAQRECLELFLDFLPKRYPDLYTHDATWNTMYVQPIETTFRIADWWDTRPLELCERMVQEI
jgi:hypothetical protein